MPRRCRRPGTHRSPPRPRPAHSPVLSHIILSICHPPPPLLHTAGSPHVLFTSPRSPGTWLDLGLVLGPGQPLAFLRAGRAGRWAEGRAPWIQPPAQVQLPGARRATVCPLRRACRAGGSVLGPGPGCRDDHWAILCPSGHIPWPLSEAVPRGGQSQQVDLEPLLPPTCHGT